MGLSSPFETSSSQVNVPIAPRPTAQAIPNYATDPMTPAEQNEDSGGIGSSKVEASTTGPTNEEHNDAQEAEEARPPLPPRPSLLRPSTRPGSAYASKPTTGLSSIDIQTLSFPDGSRGTFSTPASRSVSESVSISGTSGGQSTPSRKISRNGSDFDDSASLMSYAPTLRANGDLASLLDEGLNSQSAAWKLLSTQTESVNAFETVDFEDASLANFENEFDEIEEVDNKGTNGGRFEQAKDIPDCSTDSDLLQRKSSCNGNLNSNTTSSCLLPANLFTVDMVTKT